MSTLAQIQMQPDGRHAVMDAYGNVLGQHNSLASAQRQVQDYFTGQPAQGSSPTPAPQGGGIGLQPLKNMPTHGFGGFQPMPQPQAGAFGQLAGNMPGPGRAAPAGPQNPQLALQADAAGVAQHATPVAPSGLGGPGAPSQGDIAAGMQFGQAFSAAHPHANAQQLVQLARQQAATMQAQSALGKVRAQQAR